MKRIHEIICTRWTYFLRERERGLTPALNTTYRDQSWNSPEEVRYGLWGTTLWSWSPAKRKLREGSNTQQPSIHTNTKHPMAFSLKLPDNSCVCIPQHAINLKLTLPLGGLIQPKSSFSGSIHVLPTPDWTNPRVFMNLGLWKPVWVCPATRKGT